MYLPVDDLGEIKQAKGSPLVAVVRSDRQHDWSMVRADLVLPFSQWR
jgi:hypothetical protein